MLNLFLLDAWKPNISFKCTVCAMRFWVIFYWKYSLTWFLSLPFRMYSNEPVLWFVDTWILFKILSFVKRTNRVMFIASHIYLKNCLEIFVILFIRGYIAIPHSHGWHHNSMRYFLIISWFHLSKPSDQKWNSIHFIVCVNVYMYNCTYIWWVREFLPAS